MKKIDVTHLLTSLLCACFLWASVTCLSAQTDALEDVGIYPFTSELPVENGFINATNGDLHLAIPLGSFTQRGGRQYSIVLAYDSAIWEQYSSCCWEPDNVPCPEWTSAHMFCVSGWRLMISADPGYASADNRTVYTCAKDGFAEWQVWNHFSWRDPNGATHLWPGLGTTEGFLTLCGDFRYKNSPTADALAGDSSGYHMYITNYSAITVYGPDGTQVYSYPTLGYQNPKDANGNYFTLDSNNNIVDTLGRTPVTITKNGNTFNFAVLNSQGNTSTFVATLGTNYVSTNFGLSHFSEYSGAWGYLQSLAMPDGTSYTFGYDVGTTPGHYGQLTALTLPTGAQINYTYANFVDAMYFVPGPHMSRMVSSRTTPDGTWTYAPLVLTSCSSQGQPVCNQQYTVTKPNGDSTVATSDIYQRFSGVVTKQHYNGAVSASNLLATQTRTYNTGTSQITSETLTLSLPNGTSVNRTTTYGYDTNNRGQLVTKAEWNFYTGSLPTTADRTSTYGYLTGSSYQSKNIIAPYTSVTVTNKNGATVSQTLNCYDYSNACGGSSFASIASIKNHDDTNYGASDTVRGDLTQVQRLISGTSNYLTTSMTYDTTGQATSTTDSNGNITAFSYADSFFNDAGDTSNPTGYTPPTPTNAYLTKSTQGALTSTFGYYWGTGQKALVTDPNSQTSYAHFYDSLNRQTSTKLPDGGWTYSVYPAGSETQSDTYVGISAATLTSTCPTTSSACRHDQTLLDGLGRVTNDILISDPGGQTTVSTAYDVNGRVQKKSNPYRSPSDSTYGWETPSYDGLDRIIQGSRPDGSTRKTYYGASVSSGGGATTQLCSASTYGLGYPVLKVDEAGNKTQSWTDGFGRLIEADEPDSTGALTVGTCYTYDLNNNLTGVTQGTRIRSFQYDLMSRLTKATNPESGTITYSYVNASGALCSGDPSAVCFKTAPSPNQPATGTAIVTTSYTYDALNRLTGKSYSDSYTGNPSTPSVTYGYDSVNLSCATPIGFAGNSSPNGLGRRTAMCFAAGSKSWQHDAMGRVSAENDRFIGMVPPYGPNVLVNHAGFPVPTNSTDTAYQYYLNGDLISVLYPQQGIPNYRFNTIESSAGRVTSAGDIYYNVLLSGTYAPHGQLATALIGATNPYAGSTVSNTFNNRLQPVLLSATAASGAKILNLTYNFNLGNGTTGTDNGNVIQIANGKDSNRTQNFAYDGLNRVKNAYTSGPNWGETYTIDAWGNLTNINGYTGKNPGETLNCAAANANNQLSTCFTYDAAGNVVKNGTVTYTYDAENRLIATAGNSYIYDGDGQRIEKCSAGATPGSCATNAAGSFYWKVPDGSTLVESDLGGNWTAAYGLVRGLIASRVDLPSNVIHYYFQDHLHSTNLITDAQGNIQREADYYPYGGEIAISGSDPNRYKFASKERDSESGLDNFGARYNASSMGRFMSPDPSNASVDFWIPQTWNRYAYVLNNPLQFVDRNGLWPTSIHTEIITNAFPGLSQGDRTELIEASYDTDYTNRVNGHDPQDPEVSFVHGMSDGVHNQDPAEAQAEGDAFIAQNEHDAQQIQAEWVAEGNTGIAPAALTAFGNALHTIEDRTSPAHVGNQPWYGTKGIKNKYRALQHVRREATINSAQMRASVAAAQQAFRQTFGDEFEWLAIQQRPKACVEVDDGLGNHSKSCD